VLYINGIIWKEGGNTISPSERRTMMGCEDWIVVMALITAGLQLLNSLVDFIKSKRP
jgi:hypothetical protein